MEQCESKVVELELARFTSAYELKILSKRVRGHKPFKLYEEIHHPLTKQNFIVYPDGLIILHGKGQFADKQRLSGRWKVKNIYPGLDPRQKQGDDYPIRVYVLF